jgi:hypothetical protein
MYLLQCAVKLCSGNHRRIYLRLGQSSILEQRTRDGTDRRDVGPYQLSGHYPGVAHWR